MPAPWPTRLILLLFGAVAGCSGPPMSDGAAHGRNATSPDGELERAWTVLFDGRSLAGWTPVGGRYDGAARWTVEDGALTGRQGLGREGGLLYSADDTWDDFELEADVRIDWPFDSGLFLRMLAPDSGLRGMQVTIDFRDGGECGGLYADGWIAHCPQGWEHFDRSGWNRFRVRCEGQPMRVVASLNGAPLCDVTLPSGEGYARAGRIGLQVHGGEDVPLETKVQFQNVRARRLAR